LDILQVQANARGLFLWYVPENHFPVPAVFAHILLLGSQAQPDVPMRFFLRAVFLLFQ